MEYKTSKNIQVFSTFVLFIALIFQYAYKSINYTGEHPLAKYFSYIVTVSVIFFLIKLVFILKNRDNALLRLIFALFELVIVSYLVLISIPQTWPYFLLSVLVIYMTFSYGRKYSLITLILGALIIPADLLINKISINHDRFVELSTIYIVQMFIWYLISQLDIQKEENLKILEQKQAEIEKQIAANKELETKLLYMTKFSEDLQSANIKLENINQKLNKSAAEYYTLQQISQAIATILDIEKLLKFVNDVIIGVLGVSYSTIAILDKEDNEMKVEVTNIFSESALKTLKENINCEVLSDVTKKGKPVLNNNVTEEEYPFVKGRNVHSLLCIPLSSKNENYGLVLVEQEREDAFEDEHLKFLSAIGNQVSVALENVGLYEKMQRMATTDELTKLYNRLYFNEMLSKQMADADQQKYPMSVAIFDIDHFKKFNDTYGHLFGDLVLKTIAKLAKDNIREQDLVARFGGEEFVIVMPNTTVDEAYKLIEDLREKIARCHVKEGSISASVTASFGISCYPEHGTNEAEILSAADNALYKAKTEGRNCTRIFNRN